ncbi:phosphoserine phosphatase SerB [Chlorobaculum sp. MV4-Y]|uniref:phosphoserine phosphatase SerB n=1 Tax=Chlorobaculum sp. MV4-Y TaxID=2976335 RepID=UPI003983B497
MHRVFAAGRARKRRAVQGRNAGNHQQPRHRHRFPGGQHLPADAAARGVRHGLDLDYVRGDRRTGQRGRIGRAGLGNHRAGDARRTRFHRKSEKRVGTLAGLEESTLQKVAERLQLTEGAEHLFHNLHRLGFKTAILSGGFTYFGRYLQKKLNIDYVFANELEIVDGKMTGNVIGQVVDGKRKAALLEQIAATEHIRLEQTVAVGDGANDLPMLGKAGLGIAFRAKPIVRETARQSISTLGLDAILYLMGFRDRDSLEV